MKPTKEYREAIAKATAFKHKHPTEKQITSLLSIRCSVPLHLLSQHAHIRQDTTTGVEIQRDWPIVLPYRHEVWHALCIQIDPINKQSFNCHVQSMICVLHKSLAAFPTLELVFGLLIEIIKTEFIVKEGFGFQRIFGFLKGYRCLQNLYLVDSRAPLAKMNMLLPLN
jgi:hypothetical protein